MGYAGGTLQNPTYRRLGDHTESIQIVYDPSKTSYEALLDVFWESHNPCATSFSRQYMSAIWTTSDEQHRRALASKARAEKRMGKAIRTEIARIDRFWWAEDYHQKYYLRQDREIAGEFLAIYPSLEDFVDSTAVTRANAYVGGHGPADDLDRLGLSADAAARLKSRTR